MNKISNLCWILVIILGFTVLVGHVFSIGVITTILPIWVSMKFATALCFCAVGAAKLCENHHPHMSLLFNMLILAICSYTIGDSSLFSFGDISYYTVSEGLPSLATLAAFGLISITSISNMIDRDHKAIYWALMAMSCIAFAGYVLSIPFMFYFIPAISTGMALHTAIGFLIIAFGMRWERKQNEKEIS